jgi:branched-chain amino acid transport system permease protein/neutral amino acid transport system permease protein
VSLGWTTLVFGGYTAALLAIGAVGFTLQFGVTNVLNLSYGAIMTSAIYVDYLVGRGNPNIWLALAVGAVWGGLATWLIGHFLVTAFVRRGTSSFGMAMVTIALGLIIEFSLEAIQGPLILSFHTHRGTEVRLLSVIVSTEQLIIVGAAILMMLLVHLLLKFTRLGLAMRATAADASLTRACGVSTGRIRGVAWLISGALCGIAGVLLGITQGSFNSATGADFFITLVAAAIVGGIGKPYGAMVGALIVGLVSEGAASVFSPSYKYVIAFAILVVVLMVRPQGIFAEYASTRELVG